MQTILAVELSGEGGNNNCLSCPLASLAMLDMHMRTHPTAIVVRTPNMFYDRTQKKVEQTATQAVPRTPCHMPCRPLQPPSRGMQETGYPKVHREKIRGLL
eukprot:6190398-Pleurochrysis_carterae.AAC.3